MSEQISNNEVVKEIKKLQDFLNTFCFVNNVLQNYNCEFQPQLDEMIERFNK